MALTKDFKETVQARARRDPAFRQALLQEALTTMLEGDLETGKAVLRDYINATIGFEELGRATGTPPKSLMRMFGPRGPLMICPPAARSSGSTRADTC